MIRLKRTADVSVLTREYWYHQVNAECSNIAQNVQPDPPAYHERFVERPEDLAAANELGKSVEYQDLTKTRVSAVNVLT
ncbi:MAG: hypothetical protein ACU0DI_13360 [Paracoccaceae bacterium]